MPVSTIATSASTRSSEPSISATVESRPPTRETPVGIGLDVRWMISSGTTATTFGSGRGRARCVRSSVRGEAGRRLREACDRRGCRRGSVAADDRGRVRARLQDDDVLGRWRRGRRSPGSAGAVTSGAAAAGSVAAGSVGVRRGRGRVRSVTGRRGRRGVGDGVAAGAGVCVGCGGRRRLRPRIGLRLAPDRARPRSPERPGGRRARRAGGGDRRCMSTPGSGGRRSTATRLAAPCSSQSPPAGKPRQPAPWSRYVLATVRTRPERLSGRCVGRDGQSRPPPRPTRARMFERIVSSPVQTALVAVEIEVSWRLERRGPDLELLADGGQRGARWPRRPPRPRARRARRGRAGGPGGRPPRASPAPARRGR